MAMAARASEERIMRDVERIIAEVQRLMPDVQWRQLQVTHPGVDDDGLWFFRLPFGTNEVQIESTNGTCPFLVEHGASNERYMGDTIDRVVAKVVEWLRIGIPQDIEVVMTFLRTEDGGRKSPVWTGYRPQFYYQGGEGDAQHTYLGVDQVNPGDTVAAQLKFYSPQNHVGKIAVEMAFEIREGKCTVATGRVTKILHLDENAATMKQG
jgi:hypothetical protein